MHQAAKRIVQPTYNMRAVQPTYALCIARAYLQINIAANILSYLAMGFLFIEATRLKPRNCCNTKFEAVPLSLQSNIQHPPLPWVVGCPPSFKYSCKYLRAAILAVHLVGDGVCLEVAARLAGRTVNLSGHLVDGSGESQLGDGNQNDDLEIHFKAFKRQKFKT